MMSSARVGVGNARKPSIQRSLSLSLSLCVCVCVCLCVCVSVSVRAPTFVVVLSVYVSVDSPTLLSYIRHLMVL